MELVVVTKVIATRPIILYKECAGYPVNIHFGIIHDYFKIINMGTDIIISIPSWAFYQPDVSAVSSGRKAHRTKQVGKGFYKGRRAGCQAIEGLNNECNLAA